MVPLQLPPIAGREAEVLAGEGAPAVPPLAQGRTLESIRSAFACALHMHQPSLPAGADGALISHLQFMFEHPDQGDNHNAAAFADCYRRMADLLPQLINEGCQPRIMLDYSGTLLWGFEQMGRRDILDALRFLACDPSMVPHVEWLGSFWGHAVAPSTPIPDLKLQILAWRQHFADLFGLEALQRVRGFSLPEMALPNHPDTLHALVSALNDCGYQWLLLQEHSVENPDGSALRHEQKYGPNRLIARNSQGDTATITALIKTQGSDTKLVGQMQPCAEALGLEPIALDGRLIPPLVSQIADGENGGVMMNEFPAAFLCAHRRLASEGGGSQALNGSEYLAMLQQAGLEPERYPAIQAVQQQRLWSQLGARSGPTALTEAIAELQASDGGFSMEGASWTNHISWVEGYGDVLEPMQQLSARFHQLFDPLVARDPAVTGTRPYQEALLHLLLLQTSCFRYWGQGSWTDHARELQRRGLALVQQAAAAHGMES